MPRSPDGDATAVQLGYSPAMSPVTATLSPRRLAPDLAKLPIAHNPRALSVAEGVRAALAVAVIIALNDISVYQRCGKRPWPPCGPAWPTLGVRSAAACPCC